MSLKRILVGSIVNRDLEIFAEIKRFVKINYNIHIKDLIPQKKGVFNLKYFKKKIKKYNFSFFILKLFSQESNIEIYDALKQYAPNIPYLNSVNSVQLCESRRAQFKHIEEKIQNLNFPKSYYSIEDAREACVNGKRVIVKLDDHNSPYIPKERRILGVPKFHGDFDETVKPYKDKEEELFFQDYLGKFDIIYKVYIIDKWVVAITSKNRLREQKYSPLELVHIRVPLDKEFKRRILRLGRKFGMSIFGVDYVLAENGRRYIVDINDFPSFSAIPEAVSLISDYMYKFISARQTLTKLPMSMKVKTYTL